MKKLAIASCLGMLMVSAMNAQEFSRFTFNADRFTQGLGDTGRVTGHGLERPRSTGVNLSPYVASCSTEDMTTSASTLRRFRRSGRRAGG